MPFHDWFGHKPRRVTRSYHLGMELLEDRTVPSAVLRTLPSPAPAAVTHLQVLMPGNVQTGQPFTVLVEAEDAHNRVVAGYNGIIHFSLGTADAGASLPANYSFTAGDAGVHAFTVTLANPGNQTIKVSDSKKHSGSGVTHAVQTATHFLILNPATITQGRPTTITVEAVDAGNHVVAGYMGTVSLFSTDPFASLPGSYAFQASDKGAHQFTVTFGSYGPQVLSVGDVSNTSMAGSVNANVSFNPFYIPSFANMNGWGWNGGWNYW